MELTLKDRIRNSGLWEMSVRQGEAFYQGGSKNYGERSCAEEVAAISERGLVDHPPAGDSRRLHPRPPSLEIACSDISCAISRAGGSFTSQ